MRIPLRKPSKRSSTSSSVEAPPSLERHDSVSSTNRDALTGHRIHFDTSMSSSEIQSQSLGPILTTDADGQTPVYIASAHMGQRGVHPCKYVVTLGVRVPYAGQELEHEGKFDLLPFDFNKMEWREASYGQLPPNRKPIYGGYEENGQPLYHAMAIVNGVSVPGKTGPHLVR
jgi:hypothetical protein